MNYETASDTLDFTMLTYPVTLRDIRDIGKFERINGIINLLLAEKENLHHYSTIKNFSVFLRSQHSKYHGKYHYCYTCLYGFTAKKEEKHEMSVY